MEASELKPVCGMAFTFLASFFSTLCIYIGKTIIIIYKMIN